MFYYILIFNKLLLFSYVVSARNHHPRYKTEDQKTTLHHWSTTRWCTKERRRWAGHHQFMPTFLVHMPLPFPAPSLSRRQCCGCVSFSEFSPPCYATWSCRKSGGIGASGPLKTLLGLMILTWPKNMAHVTRNRVT